MIAPALRSAGLLAGLLAGLALAQESATTEPPPLFRRVLCVGASITEGFGLSRELGGTASLDDFVELALVEPGEVSARGSASFFSDPEKYGLRQVARIEREEPSLVLGVEFLFWFSYGAGLREEQRVELFERGLAMLERVQVPLVLGDVPDMSPALRGRCELTGGPLISADMVPSAGTRAALNRRLGAWAAERDHVVLLPLSTLLEDLHAGRPLSLGGFELAAAEVDALLQADLLHTTARGTALLAMAALRLASEERADVPDGALRDDVDALVEAVRERVRLREEERDRRRQEIRERRERKAREREDDGGSVDHAA